MNLQKLISQRNAFKEVIKRLLEKIETAKTDSTTIEFDTILEALEKKAEYVETLNEKILNQKDADDVGEEIISTEEYKLDLEVTVRKLREFREKQHTVSENLAGRSEVSDGHSLQTLHRENRGVPRDSENTSQRPGVNLSGHTVGNMSCNSGGSLFYRLPKLTLPTFCGDILTWQTFWDSFESTVHLNDSLSDIQKFSYLKSQLESEAAITVEGFALTSANYIRAVELLRERYGQQHKITHATMQALLQLPAPLNNLRSLRHFNDRMETYIRGLDSLGQHQGTYGNLLVPVILDKLPADLRRNLTRSHGNSEWDINSLRRAIISEINIMEAGDVTRKPEVELFGSAASFYTATRTSPTERQRVQHNTGPQCAFCHDSHPATECRKYADHAARITIVKRDRLCYNCLGKHPVSTCRSHRRCYKCHRKHHTSICISENTSTTPNTQPEVTNLNPEAAVFHSTNHTDNGGVLLKTAVTEVCFMDISRTAAILLDEGAQKSFITKKLADELQLPVEGVDSINVSTFGGKSSKVHQYERSTIYIKTDSEPNIPVQVLIVPTIAAPMDNHLVFRAATLPYLRGLKLAHPVSHDRSFLIDILIGADHYWDIVLDDVIRGNGPTAVRSKIGYLLSGPLPTSGSGGHDNHIMNVVTPCGTDESLERFWNLESIGITATEPDRKSREYLADYQQTCIEYTDGRYHAMLPWKQEHPPLPTNFNITLKRTLSTLRRLREEPEMLKKYNVIINEQEKRGFIEKVTADEDVSHAVHYIPHHPVKKESSTTPIRIVYDCSCRQSHNYPSLNDCLESVPPMLNDLSAILVRFRQNRYAVTTDIEKAFLHVGLHEKDRDMTRFLWLEDPFDPDSRLITYRFRSVLFGATSSPFILNATLLKHLNENSSVPAAAILARDLYVDNAISSFTTEAQVVTYFREARNLMSDAGMNLRSWTSNSKELRAIVMSEKVLDADDIIKVLGMRWNPTEDIMTFQQKEIPVLDVITKRTILKYSAQIFDPLGLLSPVTVRAKLLLQELWQGKYDWDTPLPTEIHSKWSLLATDLNRAMDTTLRRHLLQTPADEQTGSGGTTELHIFVDASVKAYGAAAYLSNNKESRLIMAKNRVAPLRTLTLPQLELMAAVIESRLGSHLQPMFPLSEITFWSDSQVVLHWLSTTKPLKRFVANRVKEIHDTTRSGDWRYCPTHDNPADLLTRGISSEEFQTYTLWDTGPHWLQQRHMRPSWEVTNQCVHVMLEDQSDDQSQHAQTHCDTGRSPTSIQNAMNIDRFSSYRRLLRVTAYVIRFAKNCKRADKLQGSLTHNEIRYAQSVWIQDIQNSAFADEINSLKSKTCRRLPLVKQLRLFIDQQEHLRCGGRIHNAPVTDAVKFPLLLPKKNRCTQLIVEDAHITHLHTGVNATVTHLRQKFWIPSIRQCVQAVIRKCVVCRRVTGRPYSVPDPPPLPTTRLNEAPPFTVTGVDFTGALYIRNETGSETKAYICLFTCASTRALHLEVVTSLSTEAFIQAFRRFVSRKSLPKLMISDNATTFVSASNYLKDLVNSSSVQDTLTNMGTEWRFIPARAPWYGGWWERLIGLTKTVLKKVMGRAYVSLESLQTIVTEIEAILNDRPLTYVSSDHNDPTPLTPAHLLYGRRLTSLPYTSDVTLEVGSINATTLNRIAKRRKFLIEQFWNRWRTEYLTSLREQHRTSGSSSQTIQVGDVVQVHEDTTPRCRWKLAVITDVITGRDGGIRAAKIRVSTGLNTTRPITKLYPLEVGSSSNINLQSVQ